MIKCLLPELGRAGRENIWPSVMAHGPRCAQSVRHDLRPNIFPSGPPTKSIKYIAAHSVYSGIFYAVIHLPARYKTYINLYFLK